jgi:hypothetical protein
MNVNLALRSTSYDDAALARMAEHIECRAWMNMVSGAPGWLRDATGVAIEEFGGAVMIAARRLRSLLFNRVIGLGEGLPARDEHVEAVMARYWELGVERYWVHAGPHARPARLGRLLQEHGLELYQRSWVKMMRPALRAAKVQSDLIARAAETSDAAIVASIVGPAFDLPQCGAELFAALIGRRNWRVYVAISNGVPISAAGLFMEGDVGYLAFAATRPEFRRRGAQRLLTQVRIDAAADAGCHWVATETGFPLTADEPNPSYQNMLWAGFRPVAIRDNYAPPGTAWPG